MKIAADLLYPEAQYEAGWHYNEKGQYELAGAYFQASLLNGYGPAKIRVGSSIVYNNYKKYKFTVGTSISDAEKYLLEAAKENYTSSYVPLAYIYSEINEFKNYPLAIDYYKKAIKYKASKKASYCLWIGEIYERDDNDEKNVSEAIEWYKQAAESGSQKAISYLKRLGQPTEQYEQQVAQSNATSISILEGIAGLLDATSQTISTIDQIKHPENYTSTNNYSGGSSAGSSSGSYSNSYNDDSGSASSNSTHSSKHKQCPRCHGLGICSGVSTYTCKGSKKCGHCNGKGYDMIHVGSDKSKCSFCHGSGKCKYCRGTGKCQVCDGKGYVDKH